MHSVLIIDENREEAIKFKESLRKEGYKAYVSNKVKDGIGKAKDKKVHLIIIDIDCLGANGSDIIREIRSDAELNNIYLIVISNRSDDFDKVLALELGADDYLVKPINHRELHARMWSMLKYPKRVISYI